MCSFLFCTGKIPVSAKVFVPLLSCHFRFFFLQGAGFGCIARFFEDEDKFIIDFYDAISGEGEATHDCSATAGVHSGLFLPDDGAHIIHAQAFAKPDDFGSDGDYLIATIIDGACKLVSDIDAHPAAWMQGSKAFLPYDVEVIDIALIAFIKADLLL